MGRFSIETFKSVLDDSGGIAKPNRFFVSLVPPAKMGTSTRKMGAKIEYFCEAVNLPGYQLMTADARRWTYGPAEKRPFAGTSNPVQMTIIGDGQGTLWRFFHDWLSFIYDHDIQSGINPQDSQTGVYELRYKKDYAVDVAIYQVPETYDDETSFDNFTARTICFEAFPSAVIDQQLNWADNNNISRFGVQLEYLDFITNKLNDEQ